MHPMHPTIKAYIIAAQAAKPAAERARLAAAASRPRRETGAREGQRTRGMRHTCQEPDTRREQDTRGS